MTITSGIANSFKLEMIQAGHCMSGSVSPTASGSNGSTTLTSVSSVAGITIGMHVAGTNIAANTVVVGIGAATLNLSTALTGTLTANTVVISGDVFKMALFKAGVSGTYSANTTNYSQMTGNSDEC